MADGAKWYVVHTYSGYENKVKQNIEKVVENRGISDIIQEIRIPKETYTEVKGQKTVEAERMLYPSYVIIKMVLTDDSWYIVRNTRGVTGFIGTPTEPVALSEKEVEALGVEVNTGAVETDIMAGDNVVITSGSFEGFKGVVTSLDLESTNAKVIVSMFGRETEVTIPLTQIKAEE